MPTTEETNTFSGKSAGALILRWCLILSPQFGILSVFLSRCGAAAEEERRTDIWASSVLSSKRLTSVMVIIPFAVNDRKLREAFFNCLLMDTAASLGPRSMPLWGTMGAQHMIEHLIWAFRCSTAQVHLPCFTPEPLRAKLREFLYDDRPTPRCYRNPALGESPPPLEFPDLDGTMEVLQQEIDRFISQCREHPDTVEMHPVFGPLGMEDWSRSHFKHCYHHLLQFGLIQAPR